MKRHQTLSIFNSLPPSNIWHGWWQQSRNLRMKKLIVSLKKWRSSRPPLDSCHCMKSITWPHLSTQLLPLICQKIKTRSMNIPKLTSSSRKCVFTFQITAVSMWLYFAIESCGVRHILLSIWPGTVFSWLQCFSVTLPIVCTISSSHLSMINMRHFGLKRSAYPQVDYSLDKEGSN